MNTTSLDQAITAYHSSSRSMTPPHRNSSPLPTGNANTEIPNNIHRPSLVSSKQVHSDRPKRTTITTTTTTTTTTATTEGVTNEEALGVREAPDCRQLACEGERLIRNGDFEESIPLLEQGLKLSLMLDNADFNLVSVLWSLLGNAHYSLGEFISIKYLYSDYNCYYSTSCWILSINN